MKEKGLLMLVFIIVFSFFLSAGLAEKKIFIEIQGNLVIPSDGNFKDIYGSSFIYPRAKAGYMFGSHIYGFFGCGVFEITGKTQVLKEESKSKQKICLFAAGYENDISENINYRIEAGISNFNYQEEVFGEKVEGSKIGLYLGSGLVYNISDTFFATFNLGYLGASDKIEGESIKLGGIHTGIGLGVRF